MGLFDDVGFAVRTCVDLYDGCDDAIKFRFTEFALAGLAARRQTSPPEASRMASRHLSA